MPCLNFRHPQDQVLERDIPTRPSGSKQGTKKKKKKKKKEKQLDHPSA